MRWKLHVRFGERAGETDQHERLTPRPGPTQPDVKGQCFLPVGGQWFCPLVAIGVAR